MQQPSSNRPPKSSPTTAWGSPTTGSWGAPAPGAWGSPAPRQSSPSWSTPVSSPRAGMPGNQQHPSPPPHSQWGASPGGRGGSPGGRGGSPGGRGGSPGGRGGSPGGRGFSPRGRGFHQGHPELSPVWRGSPPHTKPARDHNTSGTQDSPSFDSSVCLDSTDSWNSSSVSSLMSSPPPPLRGQSPLHHNRSFPGASFPGHPNFPHQAEFRTPQPYSCRGRDGAGDFAKRHHGMPRGQGSQGDLVDERSLQAMTSDPWAKLPPKELSGTETSAVRRPHGRFQSGWH